MGDTSLPGLACKQALGWRDSQAVPALDLLQVACSYYGGRTLGPQM